MKSIFDIDKRNEFIARIDKLQPGSQPQWGKMTAYQMVKHCTLSEEMFQGKILLERVFIGRLFGQMIMKAALKNDDPFKKNQPTHPNLKITDSGNIEHEKSKWIELLNHYDNFFPNNFVHPFFGKWIKNRLAFVFISTSITT